MVRELPVVLHWKLLRVLKKCIWAGLQMGTLADNLGQVNCGVWVVTVALCLGMKGSYLLQAQGQKMSTIAACSFTSAPTFNMWQSGCSDASIEDMEDDVAMYHEMQLEYICSNVSLCFSGPQWVCQETLCLSFV